MPFVVPVSLNQLLKELFWLVVLDILGILFSVQMLLHHNWRWFAGFLLTSVVLIVLTIGQVLFIWKVTEF